MSVLYGSDRGPVYRSPPPPTWNPLGAPSLADTGIGYYVAGIVLLFLVVILCLCPYLVTLLEPKLLFMPARTPYYDNLRRDQADLEMLPSGGLLMHYFASSPKPLPNGTFVQNMARVNADGTVPRRVLFLHGNAGHIGYYLASMDVLANAGYDVYALEYHGYGPSPVPYVTPNGVLRDLYEAWQICGDQHTILAGFSMGGIVISQMYDQLTPLPAQLVFLNTTGNLPQLICELTPWNLGQLLLPHLATKTWIIQPPQRFRGSVVVVGTDDDTLIPMSHSWNIANTLLSLRPVSHALPDGGHETGPIVHYQQWIHSLLPSKLAQR